MMSPLWQRAATHPWLALPVVVIALAVLALYALPAALWPSTALVGGMLAWRLSTTARLTLLVAVLWPLVLAAVARHAWPWAEIVVMLCWMWLSEVVQRWRSRADYPLMARWSPIVPQTVAAAWFHWPLSLLSIAAVAAIVWCGGSWTGAAYLVAGLLLVCHETGQVRRSVIAIACGMLIMQSFLSSPSSSPPLPILVLLPLAVPVMRAGRVAVWPLFPGAVFVIAWQCGWSLLPIASGLLALAVTSMVWSHVRFPVRPAWRVLPPSWRWFTCAKLALDPVYRLLAEDARPWGRVLDLGCGTGLGGVVAARRTDVTHWRGIDLDARKIAVARRLLAVTPGTSGWQTCIARLPLDAALEMTSADTLLALDILHYWPLAEQAALLGWMRAQMAPHGVLLLREGTTDGAAATQVRRGECFTTAIGLNPASTLFFRSTVEWESAFTAAGFTVISRQSAGAANCLWHLSAAHSEDLLA